MVRAKRGRRDDEPWLAGSTVSMHECWGMSDVDVRDVEVSAVREGFAG
jgi:hypothetical protein